ncbi:hypothetical protein BT69DRAFT_1320099 [Atractiella rhizophila]|nr:hypothetical protein BT69DRAFT_1320099 [Atractiella rhizophila]
MANTNDSANEKPCRSALLACDEDGNADQQHGNEMKTNKEAQVVQNTEAAVRRICSELAHLDDSESVKSVEDDGDGDSTITLSVKSMFFHFGRVGNENEALRKRNKDLEVQLHAIKCQQQEFRMLVDDLQLHLQSSRQRYEDLQRDFSAIRSFGTFAETADASTLASCVECLNRTMEDIVGRLVDDIPSTIQNTPLPTMWERLTRVLAADERQMRLLSVFQERNAPCEVLFELGLRIILVTAIWANIFRPFKAGISLDRLVELEIIHTEIRKAVLQPYSSRWRSLTYNHLRSEQTERDLVQCLANACHDAVVQFFHSCFLSGMHDFHGRETANSILASYNLAVMKSKGRMESLIRSALNIKHQIQTAYFSEDFEVCYDPAPTEFDGRRMTSTRRSRSKHHPQHDPQAKVVAVLGFGLVSSHAVEVNQKIERSPAHVHLKYPVLLYEGTD